MRVTVVPVLSQMLRPGTKVIDMIYIKKILT